MLTRPPLKTVKIDALPPADTLTVPPDTGPEMWRPPDRTVTRPPPSTLPLSVPSTVAVPPLATVRASATPVADMVIAPPVTVALVSEPNTSSLPPLETSVPVADPPESTCARPAALTVVTLAIPPDRISRMLPLVTTTPELTTPDETNCVLMTTPSSDSQLVNGRRHDPVLIRPGPVGSNHRLVLDGQSDTR